MQSEAKVLQPKPTDLGLHKTVLLVSLNSTGINGSSNFNYVHDCNWKLPS